MKIIVSPSKSLDFEQVVPNTVTPSQPKFIRQIKEINSGLKQFSGAELSKLMHISLNLGNLNASRNQAFSFPFTTENSKPAVFFYSGDTYKGFDMATLDPKYWQELNNDLRIISGLYGLLRPFDLIQPYRLEMKIKLTVGIAKNLYDYWRGQLTESLNQELNSEELFVNCASREYADAIDFKRLKVRAISPVFMDFKDGKLKIISFYAKRARGAMARYLIENEIKDLDGLKNFNTDGYSFSEEQTKNDFQPVFIR